MGTLYFVWIMAGDNVFNSPFILEPLGGATTTGLGSETPFGGEAIKCKRYAFMDGKFMTDVEPFYVRGSEVKAWQVFQRPVLTPENEQPAKAEVLNS